LIEVYRHLGPGHPELVYKNAVYHELELRGIAYQREVPVDVMYKDKCVGKGRIDLLVGGLLVLELKAIEQLTDTHKSQTLAYLCAAQLRLGLLANFNVDVMKNGIKRVVRDPKSHPS
jgi:GxxExxY protein